MGLTALATGDLAAADRAPRRVSTRSSRSPTRKLLDGWLRAPGARLRAPAHARVANVPLDV